MIALLVNSCGKYIGNNIIKRATITFNGKDRVSFRDIEYFSKVQIYQHHTNGPCENGINVYSFALNPEKHQPSGVANLSQIDNVKLRLQVIPEIDQFRTAKLRTYGINYNVLRIALGVSGLVFSRDG